MRNASALGFASEIVGKGVARTRALVALVVCSFLRGLSVRDIEAALEETFEGPLVSKLTVSRICAYTRERYRLGTVGVWTSTISSTCSSTPST